MFSGCWVVARAPRVGKRVVLREVRRLLDMAIDPSTPIGYADRYVYLARRFAMKYRVRIPREYRLFICKGCKRVLRPGVTAIFRIRGLPRKHIYVKCLRCGKVYMRVFD